MENHSHNNQQEENATTTTRRCENATSRDGSVAGKQQGQNLMTDARWVTATAAAALSTRSSVGTLHLKEPPSSSSTAAVAAATMARATVTPDPITPAAAASSSSKTTTATTAVMTQEEADRQLAEALHAQELVIQQQQHPGESSAADHIQPSLDQEILSLECAFLPVLELIWPEVYWLTEKDMEHLAQQQQAQLVVRSQPAATAASPHPSIATNEHGTDETDNNHSSTSTITYKQMLYQKLVKQGASIDTTAAGMRDEIRDYGPLQLLEYFWYCPNHDVMTMEDLTVFAGSLLPKKKKKLDAITAFPKDENDDDNSWKTLPCWDTTDRLYTFQRVCKAIGFLGEEDFVDTVFVAKTWTADDDDGADPQEILHLVERRCREEADEIFGEVQAKTPASASASSSSHRPYQQQDNDNDVAFEKDLQTAIALSLAAQPGEPWVDGSSSSSSSSSSLGEKRKWTAPEGPMRHDGGDQKMGAVRDEGKKKPFFLP
eukprot:scaffold5771_cov171-Amphora_coffeaeformis.AAC.12